MSFLGICQTNAVVESAEVEFAISRDLVYCFSHFILILISFFLKFATLVADEAKAQKRKLSATEGHFFIGGEDDEEENDTNFKAPEPKINGTMETIHESHSEGDVRQRRDFMKKVGKESRHNVISRKDNLVLSPDQPPRIEEDNEVSHDKNVFAKGHFFSDHSAVTKRPDAKTQLSLIFFRVSSCFFGLFASKLINKIRIDDFESPNLPKNK